MRVLRNHLACGRFVVALYEEVAYGLHIDSCSPIIVPKIWGLIGTREVLQKKFAILGSSMLVDSYPLQFIRGCFGSLAHLDFGIFSEMFFSR